MGHYPFEWQEQDLCAEDFKHFQKQFSKTILQLIPFADGPVTFLDSTIDPGQGFREVNTQIPVIGFPNQRPEGPCKNTCVDLNEIEKTIVRCLN